MLNCSDHANFGVWEAFLGRGQRAGCWDTPTSLTRPPTSLGSPVFCRPLFRSALHLLKAPSSWPPCCSSFRASLPRKHQCQGTKLGDYHPESIPPKLKGFCVHNYFIPLMIQTQPTPWSYSWILSHSTH